MRDKNRQQLNFEKQTAREKQKTRQWFRDYKKQNKCLLCGEDHISCLQFHHDDPSTKIDNVSNLIHTGQFEKAIKEIQKCIILCANCHMKLHYNTFKSQT